QAEVEKKKPAEAKDEGGNEPGAALPDADAALTNLLPNNTDSVVNVNFKDVYASLGEAAFRAGAFDDDDLKARLGFSVRKIDRLVRAEGYRSPWTFTVIHSTEPLRESLLVQTLGLRSADGGAIKNQKYYVLEKASPWLQRFALLTLNARAR